VRLESIVQQPRNFVQGWGGSVGVGILKDFEGNSVYAANLKCQGSGGGTPYTTGEGTLIDPLGPVDAYSCAEPAFACGGTNSVQRGNGMVCWSSGDQGTGADSE
jgi:hypothetical protein